MPVSLLSLKKAGNPKLSWFQVHHTEVARLFDNGNIKVLTTVIRYTEKKRDTMGQQGFLALTLGQK